MASCPSATRGAGTPRHGGNEKKDLFLIQPPPVPQHALRIRGTDQVAPVASSNSSSSTPAPRHPGTPATQPMVIQEPPLPQPTVAEQPQPAQIKAEQLQGMI